VSLLFTGRRIPVQTYGRIEVVLIDKSGLNETFSLTT
jgi:hypothetical protein